MRADVQRGGGLRVFHLSGGGKQLQVFSFLNCYLTSLFSGTPASCSAHVRLLWLNAPTVLLEWRSVMYVVLKIHSLMVNAKVSYCSHIVDLHELIREKISVSLTGSSPPGKILVGA